jgi:sortase A
MLSTSRFGHREASAKDVAARATDAALRAAEAAIHAADAAIKAADAAVRLVDEHDNQVIMLQPTPGPRRAVRSARAVRSESGLILPASRGELTVARRPPRGRFAARALGVAMIVLGALALIDAAVTLVWQEPLSALYAQLRQDHLNGVLRKEERTAPSPAESRALATIPTPTARIAYLARSLERHAHEGSPVGRIRIPRIGVNFVVVKGTSTSALESGPGIYPQTTFPGVPGTTAIAGHRTTYLAPFRHIDVLRRGNRILIETPYAHFTYTITGKAVVAPTDMHAATGRVGYSRLVLSACTPLFSAAKRLLVYARLTRATPTHRTGQAAPAAPGSRRGLPAVLEPSKRSVPGSRV